MKKKFSEIPKGTFVLFNGQYAVKIKDDCIQIPKFVADSFYIADDNNISKLFRRGRRGILDLLVRRHLLTREEASKINYGIPKG